VLMCALLFAAAFTLTSTVVVAWTPAATATFSRRSCVLTMKRAAGRRGGLQREIGEGGKGLGSSSSSSKASPRRSSSAAAVNWCSLPIPSKQVMDQPEGKVTFIDTNLPTLKSTATNPTGAVSVLKHKGSMYCFSSSCPCCKVPLTKSKVLVDGDSRSRLVCDLCKTNYDLKTGEKLASDPSTGGTGLLGGIVKSVLSANPDAGPLPVYRLGEKNGKLLIAVD